MWNYYFNAKTQLDVDRQRTVIINATVLIRKRKKSHQHTGQKGTKEHKAKEYRSKGAKYKKQF